MNSTAYGLIVTVSASCGAALFVWWPDLKKKLSRRVRLVEYRMPYSDEVVQR